MRKSTLIAFLVCALPSALVANPSRADEAAVSASAAEALFRDAHQQLESGDVHAACEKFAASQHLEPALGTLLNLALCHQQEGKTASAWAEFTEAAARAQQAGHGPRERFARKRATALEPVLMRLVVEVAPSSAPILVKIDGAALGDGISGTPIPLDPGEHVVEVSTPGGATVWSSRVTLAREGVTERVEVPALGAAVPAATAVALPPAPPPIDAGNGRSVRRILGITTGGVGLGAVGLSVAYALASSSRASAADAAARDPRPGHAEYGQALDDQASALRAYAIVAGVAGVIGIGGGVVLFVSARDRSSSAGRAVSPASSVQIGASMNGRESAIRVWGIF